MPRPPVPPPLPPTASVVPGVTVLQLGDGALDLTRPRVALRLPAAADHGAASGADVVVVDLAGATAAAAAGAVAAMRAVAPVLVAGADRGTLEAALAAGAAGALAAGAELVDPLVSPLAAAGAALVVLGDPRAWTRSHRDALTRAVDDLGSGTLLREASAPSSDHPGLGLVVVDPGPEVAGAADPELVRARRVGAITRGVAWGARLVLTGDLPVARRAVEVLGALLTAEDR